MINKKLEHVKELWDKLDTRDRDILIQNSMFQVDTLCDWKALTEEEQENVLRWCYKYV